MTRHLVALALFCMAVMTAQPALPQDDSSHQVHRMQLDDTGMVMNQNSEVLPRDCNSISRDYSFEVSAGTEFANQFPGSIFAYDRNEFKVDPCSRIHVTFNNLDQVRHQWMVHGLPRYLYPGGMFHLEASGRNMVSGSFIVPSDDRTYLVHCDITQHMEKGMKAQLIVGGGSGDLWAVPGISSDFLRANYLHSGFWKWLLVLFLALPCAAVLVRWYRGR